MEIIPVDVIALIEDQVNDNPIVMLRDPQENRVLPIWIGDAEARNIALALNNVRPARPLTHHLLMGVLIAIGGKLSRIVIDRLKNNTYYASIFISANDKTHQIDARPSDALVLAIEAKVPVFVGKEILRVAGHPNPFSLQQLAKEQREQQNIKKMSPDDVDKIQKMLESARAREQQSSEQ
ncbi:bifunctional nuclease family protein [Candidatus Gracilibacteria bacterium]|nr:bifunctional nuclease family protein [Candidatus Gracilibacteria bacterium]